MYVGAHVCMYACMYVSMYLYICLFVASIRTSRLSSHHFSICDILLMWGPSWPSFPRPAGNSIEDHSGAFCFLCQGRAVECFDNCPRKSSSDSATTSVRETVKRLSTCLQASLPRSRRQVEVRKSFGNLLHRAAEMDGWIDR